MRQNHPTWYFGAPKEGIPLVFFQGIRFLTKYMVYYDLFFSRFFSRYAHYDRHICSHGIRRRIHLRTSHNGKHTETAIATAHCLTKIFFFFFISHNRKMTSFFHWKALVIQWSAVERIQKLPLPGILAFLAGTAPIIVVPTHIQIHYFFYTMVSDY